MLFNNPIDYLTNPDEYVRIKKGVRPFGGRVVKVYERKTYPNGRRVVLIVTPGSERDVPPGHARMLSDIREYNEWEVEPASAPPGRR